MPLLSNRRVSLDLRLLVSALVVLASPLLAPATAHAQSAVSWTRQTPVGPGARIEDAFVYDSVSNRFVMIGGYDHDWNRLNDVWEYNASNQTWADVTPSTGAAPLQRSGHAAAFDPVRRKVVMFGGLNDSLQYLGDTWEWDTVSHTWTNVTPATSPSARQGSRLVYDSANDRVILVGGVDANHFYAETWAWNPGARTWSLLSTGTSSSAGRTFLGRTFAGAAFNSSTNRVVVFGGIGFPSGSATVADFSDVWELRGSTWTDVTPASGPPGRGWTQLAFDASANRMVMFGGWSFGAGASYGDTWALSGGAWSQLASASAIRDSHGMAYDASRQRVVVYGGYLSDVIELAGNAWSAVFRTDWAPVQDQHAMTYDSDRGQVFLYGGGSLESWELTPSNNTWAWFYVGGPNGRTGATAAFQRSRHKTLLFGGRQRVNGTVGPKLGDTWEWDGAAHTWTNVTPGVSPSARDTHAIGYDAAHNRVVLFGGKDANGAVLGDTWLWNGSTWTNLTATANGPSARFGHSIAYDNVRNVLVLFGGDTGSQKLNDVWEWDGNSERWHQVTAASAPPARAFAAMSSRGTGSDGVVVFGGLGSGLLNDTWVWNGATWSQASFGGSAPSARQGAQMVFDATGDRLLLFGGKDARGLSSELWSGTLTTTTTTTTPTRNRTGDFDGDGKADVTVYRPSTGGWYVLKSSTDFATFSSYGWGLPGDLPQRGDFDGDGRVDVAVYRPSTGQWWVLWSSTNFATYNVYGWGLVGDTPVPADYDGDGKTDFAVYRPSTGGWWILKSSTNFATYATYSWGLPGDIPVAGDYDGDSKTDLAIYRPTTGGWWILKSSTNFATYSTYGWGLGGDTPTPADYDGDGKADLAVYRPSTGGWWILWSNSNYATYAQYGWGLSGDVPVPADYDGDGKSDLAVYRPTTAGWWILKSSTNFATYSTYGWGLGGDVPVLKRP